MKIFKREFEAMAVEVFKVCNERNQLIAQDLLICELDIFFNHSVLEMAITAEAYDFVCQVPVQQLLTDVWYDKISSHISIGQVFLLFILNFLNSALKITYNNKIILPYVFFPSLFLNNSYFKSDLVEMANITELDEKASRVSIK